MTDDERDQLWRRIYGHTGTSCHHLPAYAEDTTNRGEP